MKTQTGNARAAFLVVMCAGALAYVIGGGHWLAALAVFGGLAFLFDREG